MTVFLYGDEEERRCAVGAFVSFLKKTCRTIKAKDLQVQKYKFSSFMTE